MRKKLLSIVLLLVTTLFVLSAHAEGKKYKISFAATTGGSAKAYEMGKNAEEKYTGHKAAEITEATVGIDYVVVFTPESGKEPQQLQAKLKLGTNSDTEDWTTKIVKDDAKNEYYAGFKFTEKNAPEEIEFSIEFGAITTGHTIKFEKPEGTGVIANFKVGGEEILRNTRVKTGKKVRVFLKNVPKDKVPDEFKVNDKVVEPETGYTALFFFNMPDEDVVCTLTLRDKPGAVEDAILAAVSVYPNPFVSDIVVKNTEELSRISLVNAQGMVVRSLLPSGQPEIHISAEDLPAGAYLLVVEHANARKAIRIVK